MNTYFAFENAAQHIDLISQNQIPTYMGFGAWHAKQQNLADVIDIRQAFSKTNSKIFINLPRYAPKLKANKNKVYLININSNHQIKRWAVWPFRGALINAYNSCDVIFCLDKTQVKPLRDVGVKTKIVTAPLFIDKTDFDTVAARLKFGFKRYSPYYISAGVDAGRVFTGLNELDTIYPILCLGVYNRVSYMSYCRLITNSRGIILNINNGPGSSDLSGSTTLFEGLVNKKPVFINFQPWLKNYSSPNIYVYKDLDHLEELLNKDIEWIDEKETYMFDKYFNKLKKYF